MANKTDEPEDDSLKLRRALEKLEKLNRRCARVFNLRNLAGLSVEDVAREMGMHPKSVKNDTRVAIAWLRRELHQKGP